MPLVAGSASRTSRFPGNLRLAGNPGVTNKRKRQESESFHRFRLFLHCCRPPLSGKKQDGEEGHPLPLLPNLAGPTALFTTTDAADRSALQSLVHHWVTALAVALLASFIATAVFSPPFSVYFTETLAPSLRPS